MDLQFVSYPKSGRTWLRYALHLLGLDERIRFHHDGCEFSARSRPPLDLDFPGRLRRYAGPSRVVYLRRDPRDVMVSLYFQVKERMKDVFEFEGDISDFVRDPYFGARNLYEFDRQWRELSDRGLALCVSYEDCHADLPGVLRAMLDWYGFRVSDEVVRAACEGARFENMSAVERTGTFPQPWLRPRNGSSKTRRGLVGGYQAELRAADVELIDALFDRGRR